MHPHHKWYNKVTTITLITTIIISVLLGVANPIISPGVNFPNQNLFSQIIAQLPSNGFDKLTTGSLSEVDPMKSLGNVTAPLDNIWRALGSKLNINSLNDVKAFLNGKSDIGALKSSLASGLGSQDTSTIWRVLGIAKSGLILVANILVAILEVVIWILKDVLSLAI